MRLFFIHVPKCAGMTLHHIIEQNYAPDEIYTVPAVRWNDKNFVSLRDDWTPDRREKIQVVKGHMNYGWHRAFNGDYGYLTILRHPVERVLSLFSFAGDWHRDFQYKADGLESFVRNSEEAGNEVTFMLSGGMGRGQQAFEAAWKNLCKMTVGTVEHFDLFLQQLAERYGWDVSDCAPKNQTPDRLTHASGNVQRIILERNHFDLMLYAYAAREMLYEPRRTAITH